MPIARELALVGDDTLRADTTAACSVAVATAVGLKRIRRREGQLLCPHAAGPWNRPTYQPVL
jgi:hypothetical protein